MSIKKKLQKWLDGWYAIRKFLGLSIILVALLPALMAVVACSANAGTVTITHTNLEPATIEAPPSVGADTQLVTEVYLRRELDQRTIKLLAPVLAELTGNEGATVLGADVGLDLG